MIQLLNSVGHTWITYFGIAVLQNTLFLGIVLIALGLLRNTRAGLRYGLCMVAMGKLLLPPFLPAAFPGLPRSMAVGPAGSGFVTLLTGSAVSGGGDAVRGTAAPGVSMTGTLFALWAGAALFLVVREALSHLRLARGLMDAVPVSDGPGGRPAGAAGIEILKSDRIPVALTLGLLKPRIYVPKAWDRWSCGYRSMVVAHEAAHLRKLDRLGQVFQTLAMALYFFHPLVWVLNRKMNGYREMVCDDAVTEESPETAEPYAQCLLDIAEQAMRSTVSWGSAAALLRHKGGLMRRVRYQLEGRRMTRLSLRNTVLVIAGALLLSLPLSWYRVGAETRGVGASAGAGTQTAEEPVKMQKVEMTIVSGEEIRLDGKRVDFEDLRESLETKFPADRDHVVVNFACGPKVPMDIVTRTSKLLVDLGLTKVIYEMDPETSLPIILPSEELREKFKQIADEHAMEVRVAVPGFVDVDGTRVPVTQLAKAVEDRLAEDPYMVVSLSWVPTARFDDFIMALALTKSGGAQRIAIQLAD